MKKGEFGKVIKHKLKIPYYEQAENAECGICCMSMIMSYYYCEYTTNELRELYSIGRDGLNLLVIKKIFEEKKFKTKSFRIRSIYDVQFPSILNVNRYHFIVAEKRTRKGIMVIDPQRGRYELEESELSEANIAIGLQIERTEFTEVRKSTPTENNYKKVIGKGGRNIVTAICLTFLLQIIALAVPIIARMLIDNVYKIEQYFHIKTLLLIICAFGIIYLVLNITKGYIIAKLQVMFNENISKEFVKKILLLPNKFFSNRSSGDIVHRYTGTVIVREMLSSRIISIWLDVGIIILYSIYMDTVSLTFFELMLIFAILIVVISLFNLTKSRQLLTKEILAEARTTAYFNEIVHGINVIKMKGGEEYIYNIWNSFFKKQMEAMKNKSIFMNKMTSILSSIQFVAPIVLLVLGVNQIILGSMTIGTVFSVYMISQSFYAPINSIVSVFNEVLYANSYFKRISEIYMTKGEDEVERKIKAIQCTGKISVRDLCYKYNMYGKNVLNNISLDIERGEMVGVVGETGSGKSTLAMLLMGLEDASDGKILFDNRDISEIDRKVLRRQIGVVGQDNYFFKDSIKQNILFGEKSVPEERVIEACKRAAIWDDIEKMPMGIETILSENAKNISGGQKQRLALARAIINEPQILILDEATSALDNITEKKIQKALKDMKCTRIVIAHRLDTVVSADKIVVLKDGKILGIGKHEDLMKNNEYYNKLYQKRKNSM